MVFRYHEQLLAPVQFRFQALAQKVGSTKSVFSGRLKIAQRFIAGIGRRRDEVREADG
ncbi:MAG: hypothetical protein QOE96_1602 [Blastocatellia bacterium]|nr:hypothetical protein [Blastocatellia bacterium]